MKRVYSGLESSGKTLMLSKQAERLLARNARWLKKSGIVRPIASNILFSDQFMLEAHDRGIPIVYWTNLDELLAMKNCDVLIDEIGNYFDARLWADISLDVRSWVQQSAKLGVEMYAAAQDFAQIDKSFRRLVNELFHITKVIGSPRPSNTRPPIKFIWGMCWVRELDPRSYDEDNKQLAGGLTGIGHPFLISKIDCNRFDTTQRIMRSRYPHLTKVVQTCLEDGYTRVKYI